ncbi:MULTISPECIES: transglycosylase domain-containing protein [unclassified Streptomyces]|uniref:transglycosylase domain-containing protein n=1 Tax=unclassified Streptomyces TaxID=2593676 RepID=UPI001F04F9A7|nr:MULTISPECIES: transglycosylase domain-containing protein [unclassified Streptomyces]MCH0563562.1 transglycosylase domain-containing protein [Streptomyces sp. MUM 2J]MCH0570946.1 transglycosylase domain-containing protein [Streptomyces sp. MUM 136J]
MGRADERRARQRGGRRAAPGRRRSSQAGGKSGIRRLFTWKKILGTFLGLCLLGIGGFIVLYMMIDIPEGNADAKLQSNIYKYADGSVMTRDGERNREIVDLAHVPKKVQMTFVAAENKTFYKDSGVDLKGTARGLVNTLSGKGAQGGSTITQQYVKNYYLSQEQTVSRKLKELVISLKLDREKSKDYILAGYINTSYYGRGAYGIQAAAQAYYRVDADKLTVEQGAYLAALLQAPNQYDWAIASATGKELVQKRWEYVLNNMVEEGWLDQGERAAMKFPVPKDPKPTPGLGGQKGYLVEAANAELARQLVAQGGAETTKDALALIKRGGWTITLNIDKKKQSSLEKAVKDQLTDAVDKKDPDDTKAQAGAVSVDPRTGAVVAMYGGVSYFDHYTNNATRTDYQPASTFKPVVLAAALEEGAETQDGEQIGAHTFYDGKSRRPVVDHGRKVGFAPENEDDADYGDITVQTAMNKSVNSVFAQMGVDVGMRKVLDVGGKLGMDTEKLDAVPAQTLGTMGASPLQMAGVYATLDNHGKKVTPTLIKSVESNGRAVSLPDAVGDQTISRDAADAVTSVLTGVVDDGTARVSVRNNPARNGQKVAGKTGTAENNVTAWFNGYTPSLVTTVGVFGEDPEPPHGHVSLHHALGKPRINGGDVPAKIWAEYTFDVQTKVTEFDLETDQGAAVEPPVTQTPSESPTESEEPSESPTTEEPTETPTSETPTETPTTEAPTETPSETPPSSSPPPSQSTSQTPDPPLDPQVRDQNP